MYLSQDSVLVVAKVFGQVFDQVFGQIFYKFFLNRQYSVQFPRDEEHQKHKKHKEATTNWHIFRTWYMF